MIKYYDDHNYFIKTNSFAMLSKKSAAKNETLISVTSCSGTIMDNRFKI